MRYFLLEGKHVASADNIPASVIEKRHAYLQRAIAKGHFLFSRRSLPPHGGFLVARAESRDSLHRLLAMDPFVKAKVIEFTRIAEFSAADSFMLRNWFA